MNQALIKVLRNHSVFLAVAILLATAQTTLWPFLTGLKTAPQFWLIFISYFILTRTLQKAIVIVYFYGFVFSCFSLHPVGYFYLSLLILTVLMSFARDRLLGPGGSSGGTYLIASMTGVLFIWHASTWLLTWAFDTHPAPAALMTGGFEWLLTLPFVAPVQNFLRRLDKPSSRPSVLASVVTGKAEE